MGRALLSKYHSRSIPVTMLPHLIRKKFPRGKAKVIITREHSMIFYRYEDTPCPGEKQPSGLRQSGRPIGINLTRTPSISVGASGEWMGTPSGGWCAEWAFMVARRASRLCH